jgi:hypothetical protein
MTSIPEAKYDYKAIKIMPACNKINLKKRIPGVDLSHSVNAGYP